METKKIKKQLMALAMVICMVITVITPMQVKAAEMSFEKEIKIHTGAIAYGFTVQNIPDDGKVTKVTVSNKNLATASVSYEGKGISVTAKKPGTLTMKTTVTYGSETKTFTTKVKIYKYTNPCKSYTIDGKQIKGKFKNATSYNYKLSKNKKVKFNVKAKSGWKITSFAYHKNGSASKYFSSNSPTISLKKKNGSIQINFTNQKTQVIENLCVWLK